MSEFSSNQLLAQIGLFIGRGAILSLLIVMLVLPGILVLSDSFVTGNFKNKIKSFRLIGAKI